MSILKKSFFIHIFFWIILSVLGLFTPIATAVGAIIIFGVAGLSYALLTIITGASDPLYTLKEGTQIPDIAWDIYTGILILLAILLIGYSIHQYKNKKPILLFSLIHVPIFAAGLILSAYIGSFYFPFRL